MQGGWSCRAVADSGGERQTAARLAGLSVRIGESLLVATDACYGQAAEALGRFPAAPIGCLPLLPRTG
jgi:hypothetical protein